MRFLFINHIQNANQSLRSNRVRSTLTMLGVTIGVASITAILALSGGANQIINKQVDASGGNLIIIRPGKDTDALSSTLHNQPSNNYNTSTLLENDLTYIKNTKHVKSVAPVMILSGTIKSDSIAPSGSQIVATTPDLATISHLAVRDGQFIDDSMTGNVAVIGTQLSINIFGTESSIGRTLLLRNQKYTVVGILHRINDPINYDSIDFNNTAIISFNSGKKLNKDITQIQQIDARVDTTANLTSVVSELKKSIRASHDGENNFSILTGNQISRPTSQLFQLITGVSTAIATISLFIGGIGIMNIMLVTVAERTREIGIRKALGASNNDILWQFIIESLVISIGGGISGCLLGYIAAFLIGTLLSFAPAVNLQICLASMSTSLMVGVIFGIYPAVRAATKNPIESLYQYN